MKDRENGERGSGISMLAARHDDDDDIYVVAESPTIGLNHSP